MVAAITLLLAMWTLLPERRTPLLWHSSSALDPALAIPGPSTVLESAGDLAFGRLDLASQRHQRQRRG